MPMATVSMDAVRWSTPMSHPLLLSFEADVHQSVAMMLFARESTEAQQEKMAAMRSFAWRPFLAIC